MLSLLLVEDDLDLAQTVVQYLELEETRCDHESNGVSGLELMRRGRYDALLLDLNLPRMDGLTLCQRLRAAGDDTPIRMLTARDWLDDKIDGFRAGTDDYLVKPFALQELVVRVQALARRRSGQAQLFVARHALHGLGGIGKTRAAVEYAWCHAADYRALLFVTAATPEDLHSQLASLAGGADDPPGVDPEDALAELRALSLLQPAAEGNVASEGQLQRMLALITRERQTGNERSAVRETALALVDAVAVADSKAPVLVVVARVAGVIGAGSRLLGLLASAQPTDPFHVPGRRSARCVSPGA